jgi:hypothetical protein
LNSEDPEVRRKAQMDLLMGYLKVRDSQAETPVAPSDDETSVENYESDNDSEAEVSEERPVTSEDKNMSKSEGKKPRRN